MWNNPLLCNLYVQSQNKCIFYTEHYQGRLWQQITLEKVCVLKYLLYWKVSISWTIYFYDTLRAACLYCSRGWHSWWHSWLLVQDDCPSLCLIFLLLSSELSCHDNITISLGATANFIGQNILHLLSQSTQRANVILNASLKLVGVWKD